MSVAAEQLQIVRLLADGTLMWRELLVAPGAGRSVVLLDLVMSDAVGATEFEVSETGEWLATVAGVRYNILPGIVEAEGRFVFIGVRSPFTAAPPPVIVPIPPIIDLKDYSDEFNRANGDPGISWALHTSGVSYLSILNNELTATAANEQELGWWIRPLPSPQWDHRVQVRIGSGVPTITYLLLRANESDGHVRAQVYGTGRLELLTCEGDPIAGTLTERALGATAPLTPGRMVSLEAKGPAYTLKVDGLEVLGWTDTGGVWPHVDDAHLNVAVGLNVASLRSRSLTSRTAPAMSIDNFAATLVEPEVTTDTNVDARFAGAGALSAVVRRPNEVLPQFNGEGSLTALAEALDTTLAAFNGEGALSAEIASTVLAEFSGEGGLSAVVSELPSITANFSGEGALSTRVSQPYADDFNRPDGPGPDWWLWHDAGSLDLTVWANEMATTTTGNEQHGTWKRQLPTPNHSVEITVGSVVASEYFLLVRVASTGGAATSYVQSRLFTNDGSVELNSKVDGGDFTRRASLGSSPPLVTGQILRFEAQDTEYILLVDGVEILRWSDTAVAWPYVDDLHRNVDVGMQSTAGGSFDNFKTTDLDAPGAADFAGDGTLSATAQALPSYPAAFAGDGTLSATAEEASLEPKPQFSGDGSLTARLTTYPKPISHFTFYEGSGVCARSLVGNYRLDLNDADTGWHGKAIKGPTWGVVGEPGVNNEWSVALQLTYNAATSDGPAILENHYEASATHFSVGFDKRGGAAYPGVFVPTAVAGSQWVYSPTPIPLGTPHTLVCTASVTDAAAKLYLDGVEILTVAGQTLIHRDFANSASLFDYTFNPDAYLDEVTYWDVCLTPEDVAALPPAVKTPVSDFDFRERTGPTAASLLGVYTLAASDPVTAWDNASAVAPFTGVVGAGAADEWTVALDVTLEGVMASRAAGLSIVESSAEVVIGLNHAGGFAFPGLQVGGGAWQFSATGLPLGTPRKLVCVGSAAATTLYLDGVPVVVAAGQSRDLAAPATVLDDQRALSVDNVSYWDVALTPEEVAALSPIGPSRFTPISNFDFREGEGATAASTRGAYALAATDPATAWKGQEAQGEFTGLVGKGAFSKWSMAATLTLNAVGTADEVIEECRESSGILTFALGFRYTGGQAFPGFYCTRSGVGAWSYSTTPFPLGSPYTLAFVSDQSDAFSGCRLYLNGGIVFEDDTYMTYRYYGEPTLLMGPEKPDASVDNVTYWDIALTPAEVADIPEPVEPPLLPKTAEANFSGGGELSGSQAIAALSHFDFHEAGGDVTTSIISAYTMTATDPATAWQGEAAVGEFEGVVGTGTEDEWTAMFVLTLNSVNAAAGPSRLEITYDDVGEYRNTVGFNHAPVTSRISPDGLSAEVDPRAGGAVYPGLSIGVTPWEWSTTPFTVGVPHMLICTGSAATGTTLYLDGVEILNVPSGGSARHFDVAATLLDSGYKQDAHLDNVTYLAVALTPAQVAAIPFDKIRAPLEGEGTLSAFVEDYAWYHDNFNRADGPPGDSWQLTHSGGAGDLVISGNQLTVSEASQYQYGWWKRALPGPDHKVEFRIGRDLPNMIKLMVRSSQAAGWVEAQFNPSTGQVWLMTFEGAWMGIGGVAERDERSGFTLAEGTLISLEAIGPHYTARVDGAVAGHWYDIGNEWPHNDATHVNVAVCVQGPLGAGVDYFKATDLTGVEVEYPIHGSDDFERPDGPLGSDWTVKHIWEAVTATVKNGQLWQSGNGTTQYIWAAPLPGDDMSIEFTVGDDPPSGYLIRLRYGDNLWSQVKSNVNMMTPPEGMGMEEYMGPSIATQGGPTDGGLSRGTDAWDPAIDPGSTILFEAVGQWYVISVDGRQRWSWKDTGGEVPIGADRRHVLVEMSGSTDPAYAECTLDNVVIRDLSGPVDEALTALD